MIKYWNAFQIIFPGVARLGSLLDQSTETFWESGDEHIVEEYNRQHQVHWLRLQFEKPIPVSEVC